MKNISTYCVWQLVKLPGALSVLLKGFWIGVNWELWKCTAVTSLFKIRKGRGKRRWVRERRPTEFPGPVSLSVKYTLTCSTARDCSQLNRAETPSTTAHEWHTCSQLTQDCLAESAHCTCVSQSRHDTGWNARSSSLLPLSACCSPES